MSDEHLKTEAPEMAYTSPAEGQPAFQFSSQFQPPQAPPPPRPKKQIRRHSPLLAAIIILLVLGLAVTIVLCRYSLVIQRSGSSISIQVLRRNAVGLVDVPVDSGGEGETDALTVRSDDYQWNGATLSIAPGMSCGEADFRELYRKAAPSVGCLTVTDEAGERRSGAAIVMTEDGALIASTHILNDASHISVSLNGEAYSAYIVGLDYATDLAVLKIDAVGLTPAQFSSGKDLCPGDWIAVVGNPVGDVVNIAGGLLSAVNPDFSYRGYRLESMQFFMALGDIASGSALLNAAGQVVGIVNMDMASQLEDSAGVSFAISMHSAKSVIDELLQNGYVAGRPSSGLTVSELPAAYAAYYGYPSCLYISTVDMGGPAWEAGLRRGDLILAANGTEVNTVNGLYSIINGMRAGDTLTLTVFRSPDTSEVSFTLVEAANRVG